MNQLSVVLARYPFTNQIDYKIRPAVIISNPEFNRTHQYFLVCPITSKSSNQAFELKISESDFNGKLEQNSFIRTDTISSMEKELFLKELGKITPKLFSKLKQMLLNNF